MTPEQWEEFEKSALKQYNELLVWQLMNEEAMLASKLSNPFQFGQMTVVEYDKLNMKLRIVQFLINRRINAMVGNEENNVSQND